VIPTLQPQAIEYPFDTTRTITSLLINGGLAKHPDIRWIFSHGGGATPMLAGRMAETVGRRANAAAIMPNGVAAELRKLYYDTASAASPASLAALRMMAPASHILYGSDYPFVKAAVGIEELQHTPMSDAERVAIDRGNALALLARLKGGRSSFIDPAMTSRISVICLRAIRSSPAGSAPRDGGHRDGWCRGRSCPGGNSASTVPRSPANRR